MGWSFSWSSHFSVSRSLLRTSKTEQIPTHIAVLAWMAEPQLVDILNAVGGTPGELVAEVGESAADVLGWKEMSIVWHLLGIPSLSLIGTRSLPEETKQGLRDVEIQLKALGSVGPNRLWGGLGQLSGSCWDTTWVSFFWRKSEQQPTCQRLAGCVFF